MSKVDEAVGFLRGLPPAQGEGVAAIVLTLKDKPFYNLTSDEAADVAASDAEEARGDFATDDEVRATWAKHGL